ncbi:MAG TPA: hypothetical protein VN784_07590 [Candidatus Limnocylindrales bacterium]|nr:hypothetical protein [Candidatus Limnocylindrales bacterium]
MKMMFRFSCSLTGPTAFPDKTKNPPPFAGDGFVKFILQPGYEFNLPPPTICVVPTLRCHAAHFGIQFILAMTGFMVRTRKGNSLRPEVNGLFVQWADLAILAAENA